MECILTLVAFSLGFLIAQCWKLVAGLLAGRKTQVIDFKTAVGYFMRSGGMPSGHTASLTAAILYLGCINGFNSSVFALGACLWIIVVYDATHVRYSVGEQGKALNRLLKAAKEPELPLVEGHTVPQVIVGAIIGIIVGLGMAMVTGIF